MMSDECMNKFNLEYIFEYIHNHLDKIKVNDIIKDENGNTFIFKGKVKDNILSYEKYKFAIQPTDETWKKMTHKEKSGTYLDSEIYKTVKNIAKEL